MDSKSVCYLVVTLVLAVIISYKFISFHFSWKKQKRRVKISLNFKSIQNDQVGDKENVCKLLAAVIENYPQLVENADQSKTVDIEASDGTIHLILSQGSDEVIDLDHVVDHVRYCIRSIVEDPAKCTELMKDYPGPNFSASIAKIGMEDQNNAELDIYSDPPIQTRSNLVIWPSECIPQEWMERFMKFYSVIHSVEQYKYSFERKGFNGLRKTNKKNIQRMLSLNMIHPGDGLYMVRTMLQYAHVAVVTDTKAKKLVHATKANIFFGEFGKIVEDHFEKVVKQEDECFLVRYQHKELTGQIIANRARTFASPPALTFTYGVVNANCEVVLNAAAGNWKESCCTLQGRRVKEPYSDRLKKMIGLGLKLVQKNPEAELLEKLYFRLLKEDMRYNGESRPGEEEAKPDIPSTNLTSSLSMNNREAPGPPAADLARLATLTWDGRLSRPTLGDLDFLATLPRIPALTYLDLYDIDLSAMEVDKLCRILSSCSGELWLDRVTLPAATWPTLAASSCALTYLGIYDMSIGEDAAYSLGCVAGASTLVQLSSVTMAWDAWARGISGALRQGGRCNTIEFYYDTVTKYGAGITALQNTLGWQRTWDRTYHITLERK